MKKKGITSGAGAFNKKHPITHIDDFLFLGGKGAALSERIIESHNIKNILQLISLDPVPALESKVNYLKLPVQGGKHTNLEPVLQQCLKFVHECVSRGQNTLVHCEFGRNRSASIVIAFIMAMKSWTLFEAERYVTTKRPIVEIKRNTKDLLNRLGYRGIQAMIL